MPDTPMKVVIDCSNAGAPNPELVAQIEADALELLRNGEVEKARRVMEDAKAAAAAVGPAESVVAFNADELAQHAIDQAAAVTTAAAMVEAAWQTLRARRDAWLLATDWMFLDQLPTDTPAATLKAIAANKPAWASFRQALREMTSTTTDPTLPSWPTQPSAPALTLTGETRS